ncbi:MAG: glycosyltransferase family 2 protein [Thermodesulfobacteriota bacterium]
MSLSLFLSSSVFLFSACTAFLVFSGSRKMKSLADVQLSNCPPSPLVSIIVPACNEEATLGPALRSLAELEYGNREIIVIDDRSTDGTYGVMEKMAREFPEIRLVQVRELPSGWLGKNHALSLGARQARGDILLFTDADVVMEASTLGRAVYYFMAEELDHLCLIFQNTARGGLLNAMVVDALGGLLLLLRPWDVRKRGGRAFIGIGAFNMIARGPYRQLGGHAALRMHPIDDVMLGKKVRQQGFVQDCLLGTDFVRVRWYETLAEMSRGLMKNIFALFSYRLIYALLAVIAVTLGTILPVWGLIFAHGAARIFFAAALLCRFAVFVLNAKGLKLGSTLLPWSLVTPYITVSMIVRAVWTSLRSGGIDWRGTHYSLRELKKEDPLIGFFL